MFSRFARKSLIAAAGLILSVTAVTAAPRLVTTDLNVRAGQSTGYRILGTLQAGTVVDARNCGDGWCYIPRVGGYASANYLARTRRAVRAPRYVPPPVVVRPAPVYRHRPHYGTRRVIRGINRAIRRDIRQDRRQDRREARQERRQDRREARQDRRQDRRDARQNRRQNRR